MPALFILLVVVGGSFWWFEYPNLHDQTIGVLKVVAGIAFAYWCYRKAHYRFRLSRHGRLLELLRSFAARLTDGKLAVAGFFQGGTARVVGNYDGLLLQLDASFGERSFMAYQLTGVDSFAELEAEPSSLISRLLGGNPVDYLVPLSERRGGPELALRRLFADLGIDSVSMSRGVLRATGPASELNLSPDRVFTVFRELSRIARVFAKPRPATRSRLGPRTQRRRSA